jgi:hypothetical protein
VRLPFAIYTVTILRLTLWADTEPMFVAPSPCQNAPPALNNGKLPRTQVPLKIGSSPTSTTPRPPLHVVDDDERITESLVTLSHASLHIRDRSTQRLKYVLHLSFDTHPFDLLFLS